MTPLRSMQSYNSFQVKVICVALMEADMPRGTPVGDSPSSKHAHIIAGDQVFK